MDNKKRKSFAHDYFNRATTFIPDPKALKIEVDLIDSFLWNNDN